MGKCRGVPAEHLSLKVGQDNFMMVEMARSDTIRAMYVIGEETAFSDADAENVHQGFTNLDFRWFRICFSVAPRNMPT